MCKIKRDRFSYQKYGGHILHGSLLAKYKGHVLQGTVFAWCQFVHRVPGFASYGRRCAFCTKSHFTNVKVFIYIDGNKQGEVYIVGDK
jgi:hypothetical protein